MGASHFPLVNTLNPEVKRITTHMTIARGELYTVAGHSHVNIILPAKWMSNFN